ncbi:MAG: hypothetical protein JWO84_578 [Parcubacteria group bacterium]|nr:hypothetical protein [Parcubacteria group bacterium]
MNHLKKLKYLLIPTLLILFALVVAVSHYTFPVQAGGLYNLTLDAVYMSDQWPPPPFSWGDCQFLQCNGPADVGKTCETHERSNFYYCYNGDTGNCGNQADSTYSCKGPPSCVPDNSCATNTCNTTSCGDGCGGQVIGTKVCGPVCSPLMGQACNPLNSCSMGNPGGPGTRLCDGSCSVSAPPDSSCPATCTPSYCDSAANICSGDTCTVTASDCSTAVVSGTKDCAAPPGATATLSATPTSIPLGSSATLTWNSTNAPSCTGSGFVTGGAPNGSISVSPAVTTTYHVTCGGATSLPVTVTVTAGACTAGPVSLTVTPDRVQTGVPTSVTFTSSAPSALGNCTLSGPGMSTQTYTPSSCSVPPTAYKPMLTLTDQSTYTLACPGGRTSQVIVNIVPKYKEF